MWLQVLNSMRQVGKQLTHEELTLLNLRAYGLLGQQQI